MYRSLALLAFFAATVKAERAVPKLSVRFGMDMSQIGTEYFKPIPLHRCEAKRDGWISYTPNSYPDGLESLKLYCPGDLDLTVCAYYDATGHISGLQYAYDKDNFYEPAYNPADQGFEDWRVTLSNGTAKEYYAIAQYFVSANYLKQHPKTRATKRRQGNVILRDEGVWVKGFKGELYNISKDLSISAGPSSIYTEQACIPAMGLHYYYDMHTATECSADSMFPWFFLTDSDQLAGTGNVFFVKRRYGDKWTESPTESDVQMIVPNGPDCLYRQSGVGIVTIHAYFVEAPYAIRCTSN